jgi:hypothetical protein
MPVISITCVDFTAKFGLGHDGERTARVNSKGRFDTPSFRLRALALDYRFHFPAPRQTILSRLNTGTFSNSKTNAKTAAAASEPRTSLNRCP